MNELFESLTVHSDLLSRPLFLVLCFAAYLLGSVPFGLVIAKVFCRVDLRTSGSGNIGTTNVARLCGLHFGIITLFCDAFKGALPVYLALRFFPSVLYASLVGLCAILGHLFSLFLRFKGGKAVATTVGVFLPLALLPLLISGLSCLLVIALSGFVSLGSLVLAAALPVCLWLLGPPEALPLSILVWFLVVFKHRENIRRLMRGEEKTFLRKKDPAAEPRD
jgi:glycerol-3-phosphate acyltransferase PlsY